MYPHYDAASTYRILGIDPGTNTLGTAILDVNICHRIITVADARTYVGTSMASEYAYYSEVHGSRAARLKAHEENLFNLMYETKPHWVICESSYMGKFAQAYMALTECICAIQRSLYRYNPTLPLQMVDPTTVKKSTGMTGRLRGKDPVKEALADLSYLRYAPGIRLELMDEHSVDAVAVAHVRACEVIQCLKESPYEHR